MAIKFDKNGNEIIEKKEEKTQEEIEKEILSNMRQNTKILTEEEYNKLPDEEKVKYIPYNPSMCDKAVAAMVRQANSQLKALTQMYPAFEKMKFVPQPLPSEKIEDLLKSLEKMVSLLDPIEKLAEQPIIGALVKPLVKLINSIFSIIGQIFYFIFALSKGQSFFMDSVTGTYDQINWKGIEEAFTDFNKQTTASVASMEIDWDAIPTEKHKKDIENFKKDLDKISDTTFIANTTMRVQKKIAELTLKQHTWEFYSDKIMSIFSKLGVDFSLLDKPTDEEMKKFEDLFPDPKKIANKISGGINKMVAKSYISIEDNEKLLNQEKKIDSL